MINHEIAHAYKGHLNLYRNWKENGELEWHKLDIRTLEWDADCYSASAISDFVLKFSEDIGQDNAEKIITIALHGAMYWMRENSDFVDIEKKDHLPYLYREITMLATLFDLVSDRNKGMALLISCEKEFNRLFNIPQNISNEYYLDMVHNYKYMKEVEDNWEKVKDMLEPFSLLSLEER